MRNILLLLICHATICKTRDTLESVEELKFLNGLKASPGDVPYHLQLRYFDKYRCSASLITVNGTHIVLTSGSCVSQFQPNNQLLYTPHFTVVGGQTEINGNSKHTTEQNRNVTKIIRHEDWNRYPIPTNDIAIVFIDRDFELNRFVQPLRINEQIGWEPKENVIISGWGSNSKLLQKTKIKKVTSEECNKAYSYICLENIPETDFCLGIPRNSSYQAACIADEGSPAVARLNDTLHLVGIFAFGQPTCGTIYQPLVYTDILYHSTWIFKSISVQTFVITRRKRSTLNYYGRPSKNANIDIIKSRLPGVSRNPYFNWRESKIGSANYLNHLKGRSESKRNKNSLGLSKPLSTELTGRTLVYGGRDAKIGEIPYQVIVRFDEKMICAGALIKTHFGDHQLIVTTARCLRWHDGTLKDPAKLSIRAGVLDRSVHDCLEQIRYAKETYIYPDFSNETLEDDIGIILLSQPFIFNNFVKSIALPEDAYLEVHKNAVLQLSGWGKQKESDTDFSERLQVVDIAVMEFDECAKWYGYLVFETSLCGYDKLHAKGGCAGDLGSPVTTIDPRTGETYLAGIYSWGQPVCGINAPHVFTKVSYYWGWIEDRHFP